MLFCEAGDHKRGKEMLLRACECYKKKRIWYSAAKTLDQAITLSQEEVAVNTVKLGCNEQLGTGHFCSF
jgi:hypothetical protein